MGLFSTVINSCSLLGEEFLGTLQTKDLDEMFLSYWIDPAGRLFLIDSSDSIEIVPTKAANLLPRFETRKTGKRGRVSPVFVRKWIRVYNCASEIYIFFQYGKISGITQSRDFWDSANLQKSKHLLDTQWKPW